MSEISEGNPIGNEGRRKPSRKVKDENFLYSRIVPVFLLLLVLSLVLILTVLGLSLLGVLPTS
jgi:hypothetical protein